MICRKAGENAAIGIGLGLGLILVRARSAGTTRFSDFASGRRPFRRHFSYLVSEVFAVPDAGSQPLDIAISAAISSHSFPDCGRRLIRFTDLNHPAIGPVLLAISRESVVTGEYPRNIARLLRTGRLQTADRRPRAMTAGTFGGRVSGRKLAALLDYLTDSSREHFLLSDRQPYWPDPRIAVAALSARLTGGRLHRSVDGPELASRPGAGDRLEVSVGAVRAKLRRTFFIQTRGLRKRAPGSRSRVEGVLSGTGERIDFVNAVTVARGRQVWSRLWCLRFRDGGLQERYRIGGL